MSINIAHRGASGYYPENTMLAFQKAVEMGCEGIETDVQITKDGVLVLCHDELLDRTTDGKGLIAETTYSDLRKLDAGIKWGENFKGIQIPTLDELLEYASANNIYLNIEMKNSIIDYKNIEKMVIDKVYEYKMQNDVIISSFNHYSLIRCKSIDPNLKYGLLYSCVLYKPEQYAKLIGVDALHPLYYSLNQEAVKAIKDENLKINTYTVNDEEHMKQLIALGIDGIITNYPDKLRKILDEIK